MHLLLPPGVLLSFNFHTYLHHLPEKNYRGLERTAGSSSYSFPEVVIVLQRRESLEHEWAQLHGILDTDEKEASAGIDQG